MASRSADPTADENFVAAAIADCSGRTAYDDKDLRYAASRLAEWAHQVAGLPLDRETVFDRAMIGHFVAVGLDDLKPSVRGNVRSILLRIAEVLLPPSRSLHRLNPLPPSEPAPPYSAAELISLRSWASSQSTPARRTNASVLLACGVGAGLSASEIGNLRVQNIVIDNAGVKVIVDGRRQREVPVLGEWEEPLRCRVDELAGNRFAFRENHTQFYPNIVSNFVNRSRVVGVRPQTQRMRTTWIIRHLAAGTHVVAFMDAAGVDSLEALTRYVRFVPRLDRREERKQLRNPRPSCPSSMFEL